MAAFILAFLPLKAQPIPPAETTTNARYIFAVYTPTSEAEALVWQTPQTRLTTHRALLNDSTEIRFQPARHTVLRTFVDLGKDAGGSRAEPRGAVEANNEQGSPALHELFCYDHLLSPEQRQLTESYLAIRHGLTLDQTLPTNYLASGPNGSTYPVWTATAERNFRHRIIGLAHDEAAGLERTEGHAVLAPDLLRLRWDETPATTAYLLIADDGAPTARDAYDEDPPGHLTLQRRWRVETSGSAPETIFSFNPRQFFARANPGEEWALKVFIAEDTAPRLIAPTVATPDKLEFNLPQGTSHFQLALRCTECQATAPAPEDAFFTSAQISPNPVRAGQPVQLRTALSDRSALIVTAYDALGREVLRRPLQPDTHHLTELTFPAPGTYSLHLRPRLKKRSAPQRTLKVVVY